MLTAYENINRRRQPVSRSPGVRVIELFHTLIIFILTITY